MATTWGRILGSVEDKLEEIAARDQQQDGKVVTIPTSLDALAKEIRDTMNLLVHTEAEHAKLLTALEAKQKRMADQMRALGIRAQVVKVTNEPQETSP